MALKIKLIEEIGKEVCKALYEGEPISGKRSISVGELLKIYKDRESAELDEKIEIHKIA